MKRSGIVVALQRLVRKHRAPPHIQGVMLECGRMRPLGWDEYQAWMMAALPFGWSIIAAPKLSANAPRQFPARSDGKLDADVGTLNQEV